MAQASVISRGTGRGSTTRHRLSVGAVLLATLAGCGAPEPEPDRSIAWSQMHQSGWGATSDTVVFLSTPSDAGSRGFLGFIDDAGNTTFLRIEALDGGQVASAGGVLCAASGTTSYRITRSAAQRRTLSGDHGSGHWTGVRADGSCVHVFNDGHTDVVFSSGGQPRHSVVPVSPGPVALTADAVWVSDVGLTDDEDAASLYRTDLTTGRTTRTMRWRSWQDPHHGTGPHLVYSTSAASDLFSYQGKLFFLESSYAMRQGTDDLAEIRPGFHAQLRLAELDPRRSRYTSTLLKLTPSGTTDTVDGHVSIPAAAMSAGHLWGQTLYTGDGSGNILAVDLGTKRQRTIGHVSDAAIRAHDVLAAWAGSELTLVVFGQTGKVTLEKYDLTTGRRSSTLPVTGFGPLIRNGVTLPYSAAALR